MAKIVGKPNAEDVKRVAVAALVAALDDGKEQARKKPGLTGMRAVATGAVLYTAGKAVFNGRRFISEHLRRDGEPEDEVYDDEEPEEDFEDEEEAEEEPAAEEDEDFEDEEEALAEEDEDFDEDEDEEFDDEEEEPEDEEDEDHSAASEPPVHPDDEDVDDADLPERPSKRREPVGRR